MSTVVDLFAEALLPRYVLGQEIGSGASATVYLARETQHDRLVALKVIRRELTSTVAADRFTQEIRTVAHLTHPNILPVHDSGIAAGMLYYVMPYVRGETLRARMDRDGALSFRDALAIAQQMAEAIVFAHQHDIVHRDIKPENVLLTGRNQVWIADFGLARALTRSSTHGLTETGTSVGSPLYMSPEQAAGRQQIDGRSDIYSLGCVVYEMLCGKPPFQGKAIREVLMQHLTAEVPALRAPNGDVPTHVEAAVRVALSKEPGDRFRSAVEFSDALAGTRSARKRLPRVTIALAALVTIAAGALLLRTEKDREPLLPALFSLRGNGAVDSTRYAVLPFEGDAVQPSYGQQRLHEALAGWGGVSMVDMLTLEDVVQRAGAPLNGNRAGNIARKLLAGRFVRASARKDGARVRVYAAVYNTAKPARLVDQVSFTVDPTRLSDDAFYTLLADSLLFNADVERSGRVPAPTGTRSRPAREAYTQGQTALLEWDLARADTYFAAALRHDPAYAQAMLWLAQVRSWLVDEPPQWRTLTESALARASTLAPREKQLATALNLLSHGKYPDACVVYDSLVAADPYDFAAAYGSGDCRIRDRVVLVDPKSPSGYRFRSNYNRAVASYQRAFQLLPSSHRGFQANAFARVRTLLFTRTSQRIIGASEIASQERFLAHARWTGDTVAFVPHPEASGRLVFDQSSTQAVAAMRRIFHSIAQDWAAAYPESPQALHALAISFDLLGSPNALQTISRARSLPLNAEEKAELASTEVWLRLKHGLPNDAMQIERARSLADSIVAQSAGQTSLRLQSLAMLTGQIHHAADLARNLARPEAAREIPAFLWAESEYLMLYAAGGVSRDSVDKLAKVVQRHIQSTTALDEQDAVRRKLLLRAARVAFPVATLPIVGTKDAPSDILLGAQAAYLRKDNRAARDSLEKSRARRREVPPAERRLDAIVPEALLLVALGDGPAAAAWLDESLDAIPAWDLDSFNDPVTVAMLMRGMTLRAQLAQASGDRETAAKWQRAAKILWGQR